MLTITIIGRPNVGKSTLFNRLTGTRAALVSDAPGLTRDRREAIAEYGDLAFRLIDTAGLEEAETNSLEQAMMDQTEHAMDEADVLCLVIDGRAGVTSMDEHFVSLVRRKNTSVIVAVNKCENPKKTPGLQEVYALGLGDPIAISAEHGLGIDALIEVFKEQGLGYPHPAPLSENMGDGRAATDEEDIDSNIDPSIPIQIAIVGRPNAGKSTLFNKLVKEERTIVSPIAGTTRDAVYIDWEFAGKQIQLVDTAGLRKQAKRRGKTLEELSVTDALRAIKYAHVVLLLMDGTQALDKQDLTIADQVLEEGRALVVVVNKWDLVEEKEAVQKELRHLLEEKLHQARGVPLVTVSAMKGKRVEKVMHAALAVYDTWNKRVGTGPLNRWLQPMLDRHPPPLVNGRRVKLRYITQIKTRPPSFALFTTSNIKALPESYLRYVINGLREKFGFDGVPIRLLLRKGDNPYDK